MSGRWAVDSGQGGEIQATTSSVVLPSDFQKLTAYRVAADIADVLWPVVLGWPGFARQTLGSQLIRAADSVAANIAEGSGRFSPADRRRFYVLARGSLSETEHWVARARARDLPLPDLALDELGRMLNGLIAHPAPS